MSLKVQIVPGYRVECSHEELWSNPNGKKRRVKGRVISTVAPHEWNVLFGCNGKVKKLTSKSLTEVSSLAGIQLHVSDL